MQEGYPLAQLPEDFSETAVAEIRSRLNDVRANGSKVLFAIESGSRAWGFPSPDSDYDCRFIYLRSVRQHLVLNQARDVWEYPIVGDVDAGGWDLRKALLLALNGNAVVSEWARSTIVYEEEPGFRQRLIALLDEITDPALVATHYLSLARAQLFRMGGLEGEINLKKLFYVVRPILALEWMKQRNFVQLPPMNLLECLSQTEIDHEVTAEIGAMIVEKARTREMGAGLAPAKMKDYLARQFRGFENSLPQPSMSAEMRTSNYGRAEDFYAREVELA
jgi:predicted nucleotidyltransferase